MPTAAAIALAVRNAIGVTVRSLPLTPAKILQALQQQQRRRSFVKPFAYVNPTNEKDAVAALRRSTRRRCRSAAARTCWRG